MSSIILEKYPVVSIIVAAYQSASFIRKCINAIQKQTYPYLEIVVINDGSTDETQKVLDELAREDSRIFVYYQENQGVSAARNNGLRRVTGQFVTFVDADDWIGSEHIETLVYTALKENSDVVSTGHVHEIDGMVIPVFKKRESFSCSKYEALLEAFILNYSEKAFSFEVTDKLFKVNCVKDVFFAKGIRVAEDLLWFWQVMKSCKKFSYVPLYDYYYVMNPNSAMNTMSLTKQQERLFVIKSIYVDCQNDKDIPIKLLNKIRYRYYRYIITFMKCKYQLKEIPESCEIREALEDIKKHKFDFITTMEIPFKSKIGLLYLLFMRRIMTIG